MSLVQSQVSLTVMLQNNCHGPGARAPARALALALALANASAQAIQEVR